MRHVLFIFQVFILLHSLKPQNYVPFLPSTVVVWQFLCTKVIPSAMTRDTSTPRSGAGIEIDWYGDPQFSFYI